MKKLVLVIGGGGFLGTHVVDRLVEKENVEVHVVDNVSTSWLSTDGVHFKFGNSKATYVTPLFTGMPYDVVVDLGMRWPLEREAPVIFNAWNISVHASVGFLKRAIESKGKKDIFKYVVGSSVRFYHETPRPEPATMLVRSMREIFGYFHRPPRIAIEFVHLPDLYGPRQLPEAGVVAADLTGTRTVAPACPFGMMAYVEDAADLIVHRALGGLRADPDVPVVASRMYAQEGVLDFPSGLTTIKLEKTTFAVGLRKTRDFYRENGIEVQG